MTAFTWVFGLTYKWPLKLVFRVARNFRKKKLNILESTYVFSLIMFENLFKNDHLKQWLITEYHEIFIIICNTTVDLSFLTSYRDLVVYFTELLSKVSSQKWKINYIYAIKNIARVKAIKIVTIDFLFNKLFVWQ